MMNGMNSPTTVTRLPIAARLGRLNRLIRKELAEILRDRRTIVTLILMPLLLYPLLSIAFQQFLVTQRFGEDVARYEIGFRNRIEADFFMRYVEAGKRALMEDEPLVQEGTRGDSGPLGVRPTGDPELPFSYGRDMRSALRRNIVDLVLIPRGKPPYQLRPDQDFAQDWQVLYRDGSVAGLEAIRYLRRYLNAANGRFLAARLEAAGIKGQRPNPIRLLPEAQKETGPPQPAALAIFVPLILILMTITGAVYPAIDLTAGERERGTLEILVAAPIPRLSVLFAKYVAVLTVAMLTAGVNLGTMTVTLLVTGLGPALFGQNLSLVMLVEFVALLFLFAAFFSAVLLALTSFARSFKEAQAYLIPLMLMSLVPGMIGLIPDLRLEGLLAVAPLLNVVLLARDLIAGNASLTMAAVVVLTTLLYAMAALGVAARIFGAEAVLYSQAGSWGDLFRRPARAQDLPQASSALFCLAVMFPAYFLLIYAQAYLGDQPLEVALFVSVPANAILFIAFPLTFLWFGRVRVRTALALAPPGWAACAGALVLGLFLWPITHEITALLRAAGLATLKAEHLEKVREGLAKWRELSPVFFLVVLAGITPLLEELFFRGYLFGALLNGSRPATAILGSAALFGVFHLFLPFGLALERFLPTTFMGAALGWLRWRSGSVWPGVILHVVHNSLMVLLGYYQPDLEATGWIHRDDEHLPALWFLGSVLASALAIIWLQKTTSPRIARQSEHTPAILP